LMRFDVITLFPQAFPGPLAVGVVGRALEAGSIRIETHDLRGWGLGVHRQVDDIPFGGGPGMVLRPEPLFAAVRAVAELPGLDPPHSILLSAHGRRLDAAVVEELAREPRLMLVCGRYEGVDERARLGLGLDEISTRGVRRYGGAGGPPQRRSCEDRRLATRSRPGAGPPIAARPARRRRLREPPRWVSNGS
jgi:tRNA (guanine37-N1)-methyltransferase